MQDLKVEAKSNINKIATNATGNGLANMTYYLLLENVNITSDGKIRKSDGQRRSSAAQTAGGKVQLDWTFAQEMTNKRLHPERSQTLPGTGALPLILKQRKLINGAMSIRAPLPVCRPLPSDRNRIRQMPKVRKPSGFLPT